MKLGLLFILCIFALADFTHAAPIQKSVPCLQCKTKGFVRQTCEACSGSKKGACSECVPSFMQATYEAQYKFLKEFNDRPGLKNRTFMLTPTPPFNLGSLAKPGLQPCTAWCAKVTGNAYKCKACKGAGHGKCKACNGKSRGPCNLCLGIGRYDKTCASCHGKGVLDALTELDEGTTSECPWCRASGTYDCPHCDVKGEIVGTCFQCQGRKKTICSDCNGLKKRGCSKCRGSGFKLGFRVITSVKCAECNGKGALAKLCKRGWVPCERCDQIGVAATSCRHCFSGKKLLCHGCAKGSSLAWEVRAKRWSAAGRVENAQLTLRGAIDRKRKFIKSRQAHLANEIRYLESSASLNVSEPDGKRRRAWRLKAAKEAQAEYELLWPQEITRLQGLLSKLQAKEKRQ